nr:unnamed protein product [Callosobruchus chinensis]
MENVYENCLQDAGDSVGICFRQENGGNAECPMCTALRSLSLALEDLFRLRYSRLLRLPKSLLRYGRLDPEITLQFQQASNKRIDMTTTYPSHASVTSTKSSASLRCLKEERMLDWKSFQRSEYCCSGEVSPPIGLSDGVISTPMAGPGGWAVGWAVRANGWRRTKADPALAGAAPSGHRYASLCFPPFLFPPEDGGLARHVWTAGELQQRNID